MTPGVFILRFITIPINIAHQLSNVMQPHLELSVFLTNKILSITWQVKHALHKHVCINVKDVGSRSTILKHLGT